MSLDRSTIAGLRQWLAEERQKSADMIASGQCEDFSLYRYSAGYIKALDDVAVMISQISSDLQKG